MKISEAPFNIRVIEAKNEMTHILHTIGVKYELPGIVLDLILSEILSDERQSHLSLMSEQFFSETIDELKEQKE